MPGEVFYNNNLLFILVASSIVLENWLQSFFTLIRIVFINSVAAAGIEGAYLTVIASLDNIGNKVSISLSMGFSGSIPFDWMIVGGWAYSLWLLFHTLFKLVELSHEPKSAFDVRNMLPGGRPHEEEKELKER